MAGVTFVVPADKHLQPDKHLHCQAGSAGYSGYAPRATIGVDVDGDGRADYLVSGVDRNRDGIPDALQVVLFVQTVLPVTNFGI